MFDESNWKKCPKGIYDHVYNVHSFQTFAHMHSSNCHAAWWHGRLFNVAIWAVPSSKGKSSKTKYTLTMDSMESSNVLDFCDVAWPETDTSEREDSDMMEDQIHQIQLEDAPHHNTEKMQPDDPTPNSLDTLVNAYGSRCVRNYIMPYNPTWTYMAVWWTRPRDKEPQLPIPRLHPAKEDPHCVKPRRQCPND